MNRGLADGHQSGPPCHAHPVHSESTLTIRRSDTSPAASPSIRTGMCSGSTARVSSKYMNASYRRGTMRRHVVAPALVVRIVHDADRAMADRLVESGHAAVVAAVEEQQRVADAGVVHRRPRSFPPSPAARACAPSARPTRRRRSRFRDACRSRRARTSSRRVACANELSDVHHSRARHVGEARVADVRVVLPDDRLRVGP